MSESFLPELDADLNRAAAYVGVDFTPGVQEDDELYQAETKFLAACEALQAAEATVSTRHKPKASEVSVWLASGSMSAAAVRAVRQALEGKLVIQIERAGRFAAAQPKAIVATTLPRTALLTTMHNSQRYLNE